MSHVSAVLLVLLAGTMWAASGTAAQDFYVQSHHIPVELTQVRLFLSSGLFFLLAWWSGGLRRGVRTLCRSPRLLLQMAVHGILGIMIVQFSYFKGIAAGDAAATTVICSTSPALMILYLAARRRIDMDFPFPDEAVTRPYRQTDIMQLLLHGMAAAVPVISEL